MQVQPHLMFDDRCEEAIEFYLAALGAAVQMFAAIRHAGRAPLLAWMVMAGRLR